MRTLTSANSHACAQQKKRQQKDVLVLRFKCLAFKWSFYGVFRGLVVHRLVYMWEVRAQGQEQQQRFGGRRGSVFVLFYFFSPFFRRCSHLGISVVVFVSSCVR